MAYDVERDAAAHLVARVKEQGDMMELRATGWRRLLVSATLVLAAAVLADARPDASSRPADAAAEKNRGQAPTTQKTKADEKAVKPLTPTTAPAKAIQLPRPQDYPSLEGVACLAEIEYARVSSKRLLLDLYVPAEAPPQPMPLVVWIHGGGWWMGDKSPCKAAALAKSGYLVASINYRLSGEAKFPAQIHDCKAAIRFLRAHHQQLRIDPERIGVWGESAGGHLAALLATTNNRGELEGKVGDHLEVSSSVQACCNWAGPTRLTGRPDSMRQVAMVKALFGGTYAEKKDLYDLASPCNHADKTDPPMLIMHGTRDREVPISQSRLLHKALDDAGADVTMLTVARGAHVLDPRRCGKAVLKFFDDKLKRTETDERPGPKQ
jgi:acetyl esterase/lipase